MAQHEFDEDCKCKRCAKEKSERRRKRASAPRQFRHLVGADRWANINLMFTQAEKLFEPVCQ